MRLTNMCKTLNTRRGFTILELLIVIAIIGSLSSVVISSVNKARTKTVVLKTYLEANELFKALELYVTTNGRYPSNSECTPDSNVIQSYYDNQFGTTTFYYFQRLGGTPPYCTWTMTSSVSASDSHVLNILSEAGVFKKNITIPKGTSVYYGMFTESYLVTNEATFWCGGEEIKPGRVYLFGNMSSENAEYLPSGVKRFAEEQWGDYYLNPNSFCFYLD